MAHGVVHQDGHELAQPERVAHDHHRLRVDLDVDAPGARRGHHRGGRVGGDVAQLDRLERQVERARVGAREQQQVLDQRGQVADLGVDVVERRAHLGHRLVLVQPQVLDAGADDGQRGAQLVAGVGRELALSPERLALGVQRGPDGHQGARRVGGTEHAREHQRQHATADEHRSSDSSGLTARPSGPGRPG